jgi:ribosomal protein L21E
MAKRAASLMAEFDAGDCVEIKETAPTFRGYKGRVVEIRTQEPPIVVRLRARTGRVVRYPFKPSQLERIEPSPDEWPV